MLKKILLILVVVIFLLFFSLKGENIFILSKPLASRTNYLIDRISSLFVPFYKYRLLEAENKELKEELNKLLSLNVRLDILEKENEKLRQYLDIEEEIGSESLVLARVLGKRQEGGTVWYLLDKGEEQGITQGLPVVNEQGVLLGEIAKVNKKISLFWPIYDSHFSTSVIIKPNQGSSKEMEAVVEGEYGLGVKASYIPKEFGVKQGDLVITSGLDEKIQKGLLVGEISSVKDLPDNFFQEAIIQPLFNEDELDIVAIYLSKTF
ncbi:rod shape-determining protein MreC [bacterium]|nr:rod shape-determining protein MreC [bacterium]